MTESIRVALRVRPLNAQESKSSGGQAAPALAVEGRSCRVGSKVYNFDLLFDSSGGQGSPGFASQEAVFEGVGATLIDSAFNAYNACVFAYGQTGSGKTFTVLGERSPEGQGVLPRACESMFRMLQAQSAERPSLRYSVQASFLEIYQEHLRDLLVPPGDRRDLEVRVHPELGSHVPGLTEEAVASLQDVQGLLDFGWKTRAVASTMLNAASSRSHAIFTLELTIEDPGVLTRSARTHFVDLAGSERTSRAQTEGRRLKEGVAINQSLTVLGRVISTLSSGARAHVPFRDSKLTVLLREAVSGNSRTCLVACVSPAAVNIEETLSTLEFARRCKLVKTSAVRNEQAKDEVVASLRRQIEELQHQLQEGTALRAEMSEQLQVAESLADKHLRSWDEAKAEALAMRAKREEALRDLGLSREELDDTFAQEAGTPRLMNLNPDPALEGCLVYYIPRGHIGVGSDPGRSRIRLEGLPPLACTLSNHDDQKVLLAVEAGAAVYVNGRRRQQVTILEDQDRLAFGLLGIFRVLIPRNSAPDLRARQVRFKTALEEVLVSSDRSLNEPLAHLALQVENHFGVAIAERMLHSAEEASCVAQEANDVLASVAPGERSGVERFEVAMLTELRSMEAHPQPVILARRLKTVNKLDHPPPGDRHDTRSSAVEALWELPYFREVRLPLMREAVEAARARHLDNPADAKQMPALPPLAQPWREVTWKEWTRLHTDLHGTRLSWEAAEVELQETLSERGEATEKRKSKGLSLPFKLRRKRSNSSPTPKMTPAPQVSKLQGICSLSSTLSMKEELEDAVRERDCLRWEVESLRTRLKKAEQGAAVASEQVQQLLPALSLLVEVAEGRIDPAGLGQEAARLVAAFQGAAQPPVSELEPAELPSCTATPTSTALRPGKRVVLNSFQESPDMNGKGGMLLQWMPESGRWSVITDGGARVCVPPESVVSDDRTGSREASPLLVPPALRLPPQGHCLLPEGHLHLGQVDRRGTKSCESPPEDVTTTVAGTDGGSSPALTERSRRSASPSADRAPEHASAAQAESRTESRSMPRSATEPLPAANPQNPVTPACEEHPEARAPPPMQASTSLHEARLELRRLMGSTTAAASSGPPAQRKHPP
uniref:Kinesin motor domain-containing protein n=1 Tax=Alexandrium monilatum TaxID=311494 RepID=A0A7S4R3V9_9DINO